MKVKWFGFFFSSVLHLALPTLAVSNKKRSHFVSCIYTFFRLHSFLAEFVIVYWRDMWITLWNTRVGNFSVYWSRICNLWSNRTLRHWQSKSMSKAISNAELVLACLNTIIVLTMLNVNSITCHAMLCHALPCHAMLNHTRITAKKEFTNTNFFAWRNGFQRRNEWNGFLCFVVAYAFSHFFFV